MPATPSMSLITWTRTAGDYCPAMETGLAGKGVVVTGGSGGIGSASASAFAAEGANEVGQSHRGRERAEQVGGAAVVGADLTNEAEVDRMFAEARAAVGQVD